MSGIAELVRRAATTAPLSAAQESLWFLHTTEPDAATYHVPLLLSSPGAVSPTALQTALDAVVMRHETLRTTYPLRDGAPVQLVGDRARVAVHTVAVAADADPEDLLHREMRIRTVQRFDLDREPPLRCVLWTGAPGGDTVGLIFHHIAIDHRSLAVIIDDLIAFYVAAVHGFVADRPPVPLQFADYAAWEHEWLATGAAHRLASERIAELGDYPGWLDLGAPPAVGARRPTGQERAVLPLTFPDHVAELLPRRARELRSTPFLLLFAAFQEAVRRWSGQERFLIGTTMTHRPNPDLERTVGYFLNTVPLRCQVRPGATFAELCQRTRTEFARAMGCQTIPFGWLVHGLGVRRAGHPLVQVKFAVLPSARFAAAGGWRVAPGPAAGQATWDFAVLVDSGAGVPTGLIDVDPARCPAPVAEGLRDDFVAIADAALAEPDRVLARLPLAPRPDGRTPGIVVGERADLVGLVRGRLAAAGGGNGAR